MSIISLIASIQFAFSTFQQGKNPVSGLGLIIIEQIILMHQQMVDLQIINQALGLPIHSHLDSTLVYISELVTFRNNHHFCNSIIANLQDEIIKIRIKMTEQMNEYVKQRLQLVQKQLNQENDVAPTRQKRYQQTAKKYPKYESLEHFMKEEFELKLKKVGSISRRLSLASGPSICIIASSSIKSRPSSEAKKKEGENSQREERVLVDDV